MGDPFHLCDTPFGHVKRVSQYKDNCVRDNYAVYAAETCSLMYPKMFYINVVI